VLESLKCKLPKDYPRAISLSQSGKNNATWPRKEWAASHRHQGE